MAVYFLKSSLAVPCLELQTVLSDLYTVKYTIHFVDICKALKLR